MKFFMCNQNMTRPPWFLLLILCLGISGCNLSAPTAPSSSAGPILIHPSAQATIPAAASLAPTAVITYQPKFESALCAFPVPRGYDPECGYLIVPENRARPDTRLLRLHVA